MEREIFLELLQVLSQREFIAQPHFEELMARIPRKDAERMIENFDMSSFGNYKKITTIDKDLMLDLKSYTTDINLFFIENINGNGLDYVFEDNNTHIRFDSGVEERNFLKLFKNFLLNHHHKLNTRINPNDYGCPVSVTIPSKDLRAFDESKYSHAEIITSVYDMISSNSKINRVSVILKYVANSGNIDDNLYHDTFDPRP